MLTPLACARLPQAGTPGQEGQPAVEDLPSLDVIPRDWGRLVSVTQDPSVVNGFRLWFESDSGVVRVLGFNNTTNQLWPSALVIRRQ